MTEPESLNLENNTGAEIKQTLPPNSNLLDIPPESLDIEIPPPANPVQIPLETKNTRTTEELNQEIRQLTQQKHQLETEIQNLRSEKEQILAKSFQNLTAVQDNLGKIVTEATKDLEDRKQNLETALEQLERRRDRIREEMRTSFAGVSQELAIKVQGFRDYLVGSLQDLAAAAEQIELPAFEPQEKQQPPFREPAPTSSATLKFGQQTFDSETQQIRKLLEQYRTRPDYYGPPWQLRRTFEAIHAQRVQNWFFTQGGRGAVKTLGSRLQNILVASTAISVLYKMYGSSCRSLILANSPERLGEWRKGLQDCLGISRTDFGPKRGIVLFEATEAVVQKAERMVEEKEIPIIIIDENEEFVSLSLLQFPLWLAFAPEPQQNSSYNY